MASPGLSEIVTTTLRNRQGKTADNVSKGNPLLFMLKEQDGWETATGRSIVQELEYAEGRFQWYAGYDILDISPSDVITAAEFPWAQAAAVVAMLVGLGLFQHLEVFLVVDLFPQEFDGDQDRRKDVVEVMRHAGGKPAHGINLRAEASLI